MGFFILIFFSEVHLVKHKRDFVKSSGLSLFHLDGVSLTLRDVIDGGFELIIHLLRDVGLVVSFDFLIDNLERVFLLLSDIVLTRSRLGNCRSTQLEGVILFRGFKVLGIHDLVQTSDFLG